MSKFRDHVWINRTPLERFLLIVVVLCLVLLATDAICAMRGLPWDWGTTADWFTGVVTLGGFVGAILALRVQTKALKIQTDQHNDTLSKEEEAQNKELQQERDAANEEKWKCANRTTLVVTAQRGDPRYNYVHKPPLTVTCEFRAPEGFVLSNVQLIAPPLPSFFKEGSRTDTHCDSLNHSRPMKWEMLGSYWPNGDEKDARAWVERRTSVVFTDERDVTWLRSGSGQLTEVK
ncbi:hypothetical protein HTS88_19335 [Pseudarthrobacter oxydans]|uniref:hypothetical protein n=1 Tax=Pseudarthrobacter oxydans TaxID=1671 RepID=UPI001572A917|nr:hypothetical protein [Pseudarthrobacter oxydans]NSX38538.1 hypothetical protein [Pseudarthrobacter oxydans]